MTRPVYVIAGGITKFAKAHPEMDFRLMCKKAFDYAMADVPSLTRDTIDGSSVSYFSDHFTRQLMAGIMVHDYLGLCPKPSRRIEGGGATGGLNLQNAYQEVASGRMECCVAVGFETMSHVTTWKGNEFIALASDTNFDFPVGGFYSGYYAMMVQRHMHEFGTTVEQMAKVSVKNHANAVHNPYAQFPAKLTVADVRAAEMVATPLTMLDICTMSDGAACLIVASEEVAERVCDRPVRISGIGTGTDAMRMSDRPHGDVLLLPHESAADYAGLKYPGVHSFRAGRAACKAAYAMAGIGDPRESLDFVELHDAYTSSEIQTVEDMGLCKYGEGGPYSSAGATFLPGVDYGLDLVEAPDLPVNPSGGLLACGHPVGATGLMQGVFALWQLQGTTGKHLDDPTLQVYARDSADRAERGGAGVAEGGRELPRRGAIHSHAGTGTYVTVSILERP